ncbi:aminoglycoside phosphotransferase family protein [Brachybacterium kimchii]|uniref:Aminoglycoside phosphotransferase family protein n=1 Tax=Brachybacterium kimchii TaxID=2942909 RepID=A0ABY4N4N3_9MICO|nr:aminoglycoside phosphotransferase family protein [Brachybacterium kimchii]UQN28264.1 aminoglycoside phosphotransferase family protein [Brachybacterium kimchii]
MEEIRDALVDAAVARWPEHDWSGADMHRGAFHQVLTAPDGPTVRAIQGQRGRERSRREASVLVTLDAGRLSLVVPRVIGGPIWSEVPRTWLTLMTTAPGAPTVDLQACSSQRVVAYAETLDSLRAASLRVGDTLPPVRAWCGGQRWPGIVRRVLIPLLHESVRARAAERVESLIDAERGASLTLCHGDFGPHNILWTNDRVDSVIDFDHACIGDPAIDLAPLISFHGAANVAALGPQDEVRRAMLHRATLPLQVASAAHLAGLRSLRDHALGNFERRADEGTLFDPNGDRPD